jgi:effector-binding domain-containing protein
MMVETAKYDVILKEEEYEVRRYHKMLVATTVGVTGSQFNRLFNYISGSNKAKSKISMTSPVITSEKIAMTAPVISTDEAMSFVVPSEYEWDTVPEPTDPNVNIHEVPERYVATIRFRGLAWRNEVKEKTNKLLEWLKGKGIQHKGAAFLMQYNPPFIPGFLRRNEVGIEIEY